MIIKKSKKKFEKLSNERIHYGECNDCKQDNTGMGWCKRCDPERSLREGKTSGNKAIDKLLNELQHEVEHYNKNIEWIPSDKIKIIKLIGEGGFANVYAGKWLDGIPIGCKEKRRSEPIIVALKELKTNDINGYISEVKIHHKCCSDSYFLRIYGITKNLGTNKYMMVSEYAEHGDLKIHDEIWSWSDSESEIYKEFLNADKTRQEHSQKSQHPQAIYTSRILPYANLSTKIPEQDSKINELDLADECYKC
ncbi:5638_t:CDS:2 [Funneliformis mosseae]|uniref:5638_t:CDS:1 n=1 Tax=Funneliformis mosseae TaxID=27381 RepID=A0A9N8WFN2_FUNMO|nr:5638_t:CDS:2 [Funneliformis mosseae]